MKKFLRPLELANLIWLQHYSTFVKKRCNFGIIRVEMRRFICTFELFRLQESSHHTNACNCDRLQYIHSKTFGFSIWTWICSGLYDIYKRKNFIFAIRSQIWKNKSLPKGNSLPKRIHAHHDFLGEKVKTLTEGKHIKEP